MNHALPKMMLATASCVLFIACSTDTAFDNLDDIDLTIQVGSSGLTVPLGSTERIPLTEAIDPSTTEVLDTLENGDFVITKGGTIDPTNFSVDRVTVNIAPTIAPAQFGFDAVLPDNEVKQALTAYMTAHPDVEIRLSDIPAEVGIPTSIELQAFQYDNIAFDDCTFSFNATNVDEALLALRSASLDEPHTMKIELSVDNLPGKAETYNIDLTDVHIALPEYLVVANHTQGVITEQTVVLTKAAGQTTASTTLSYQITGIDYSTHNTEGALTVQNGTLTDEGAIMITAQASTDRSVTLASDEVSVKNGSIKLTHDISIAPTVQIGDITFEEIAGRFAPTIDPITTTVELNLGDDLDFLKEDATIDLDNPVITLNIVNPCEVKILADITLTADNGTEAVTIGNVDLSQEVVTLSRKALSDVAYNVTAPELGHLLNPIPDQIEVHIVPRTDQDNFYEFTLGRNYEIEGDYDVNALLNFDDFQIKYDEVVENVFGDTPEDVQDLADKLPEGIEGARLHFSLINATPIEMELSVSANNTNGEEDASLVSFSNTRTIAAGSIAAPVTTEQDITLGIRDIASVRDLIVRVSGTAAGVTLNARQYIRFDNMKITLQKVTLDLNDDED